MPDTVNAYTHRIGRTGRAQETGEAFTFVTPDDTPMVRSIERLLGYEIKRRKLEGFDYGKYEIRRPSGQNGSKGLPRRTTNSGGNRNPNRGRSNRSRRRASRGSRRPRRR
jgi:ATP-dependent RNA helicase RhlE